MRYETLAGNVGTVYAGPDHAEAMRLFWAYVEKSTQCEGRCANEPVTVFADGEPIAEHDPEPEHDCNIIRDPGKFEGNPRYIRDIYWNAMLDGGSDEAVYDGDSPIDCFAITPAMRMACADFGPKDRTLMLWETSDGFVGFEITEQTIEELETEAERASGPQPEDYAISPCGTLGGRSSLDIVDGPHLGVYSCDSEAIAAARQHMIAHQFWTNVWIIDDHGGHVLAEVAS